MDDNHFSSFLDPIAKVWANAPVFTLTDSKKCILEKAKDSENKAKESEAKRI